MYRSYFLHINMDKDNHNKGSNSIHFDKIILNLPVMKVGVVGRLVIYWV